METDGEPTTKHDKLTWKPKPPVTKLQSVSQTGAILNIGQKKKVITSNRLSRSETLIQAKSPEDYRTMVKIIDEYNQKTPIQWIAFPLEEDIKPRMVLRGLTSNTDVTEMLNTLKEEYDIECESIKSIIFGKSDKRNLPMFVLTLEKGDVEKARRITNMMHMKVHIEDLREATGSTQCFNSQGYHHTQRACFNTPRCVRCGENHSTRNCQMPREQKAKCANCQGKHPANFRGCPRYPT
ncbi:uncharacterized protein [Diabrotica undecimpunctata]|uniref:uncharacterized protein n=1 Tax=Diabrotica undecimpunctata TaxID=50387 RepID=UPI003B635194